VCDAKRSRHCSGSQPVWLLQRCFRRSSSLRHPATTVSAQHSCTFGGRLIATWSCILSAARPSLAACQAARRVKTVHGGPPVLVRRRSILPAGPDHVVCWCNRQRWCQVGCIQHSRSATNNVIAQRPVIRCGWPSRMEQTATTTSSHSFCAAAVFKRQLKTFLFDRAFNWHYIVRRPCCALALTSP